MNPDLEALNIKAEADLRNCVVEARKQQFLEEHDEANEGYQRMRERALKAEAEVVRMRSALIKTAYEPIGGAEASCREVLDGCTEIARNALLEARP